MSRLVLDTSAIIAYADGPIDVGKLISEVYSDGGKAIVPVGCLVEVAHRASEKMLRMLIDHPACEVPPMTVDACRRSPRVLGLLDLASAPLLATMNERYVLTCENAGLSDVEAVLRPGHC